MPTANPAALDFLLTRRSRPAKTLTGPVPDRAELLTLLTAAARTPDHGKLEPWRFVVLSGAALPRLAALVTTRAAALDIDADAQLVVAVINAPVISAKVPDIEQTYSAGAVCLSLLNAALAAGWGANWLSGWASHDRSFVETGLGLAPHESVAGFIHIGTETAAPPERPRPEITAKTTWIDT